MNANKQYTNIVTNSDTAAVLFCVASKTILQFGNIWKSAVGNCQGFGIRPLI